MILYLNKIVYKIIMYLVLKHKSELLVYCVNECSVMNIRYNLYLPTYHMIYNNKSDRVWFHHKYPHVFNDD